KRRKGFAPRSGAKVRRTERAGASEPIADCQSAGRWRSSSVPAREQSCRMTSCETADWQSAPRAPQRRQTHTRGPVSPGELSAGLLRVSEVFFHCRVKSPGIDRLGQVVVHAGGQTLFADAGLGRGGQGDDRNTATLSLTLLEAGIDDLAPARFG